MLKLLRFDIKRLFANRFTLALAILAPVVTLLLFSAAIAPVLFSDKIIDGVTVAVFNEDESPETDYMLRDAANAKNIEAMAETVFIHDHQTGLDMVRKGEAAIYFHVPAHFFDDLYYRTPVEVEAYISKDFQFEAAVLMPLFTSTVRMFNRMQLSLDEVLYQMLEVGGSDAVYTRFNDKMIFLGMRMLNRTAVYDIEGVSPLGRFLPIEYYTAAIFAVFLFFSMVPLVGYNSTDFRSSVLARGFLNNRFRFSYLFARIISGMVYILLVAAPMVIAGILISGISSLFAGSIPALLGFLLLAALLVSSLACLLALLFPRGETGIWVAFYLMLFFAISGGVIVPDSGLPEVVNLIGRFSPMRAMLVLFSGSLYDFNWTWISLPFLNLLVWLGLVLGAAMFLFYRRLEQ